MKKECKISSNFLERIKREGKHMDFDEKSKIVFISDVHRGDGGYADSLRMNDNIYKAALNYYYDNGYTLIELGDGDELWKNKNCIDIAYAYKDIFEILEKFNLKKRLCLVYGNHDIIKSRDNFVMKQKKLCSSICDSFGDKMLKLYENVNFYEGVVLNYKPLNKEIYAFHGYQVDFINCTLWRVSRFLVRYLWRFLEGVVGFKAPTSPAKNYDKGDKIDKILNEYALKEKKVLICGHTHNDRMPKPGEGYYFNDGCCVFPSSITTLEINEDNIKLVKWEIDVNEKSQLFINKSIIAGPEKIRDYLVEV